MMTPAQQPPETVGAAERSPRTFLGHPAGLSVLFMTEMWERFGFYGMRAILVYYMIKALHYTQPQSSSLYGWYIGLVYLTPVLGGLIADRWLGYKRSIVLGGSLLALGYFILGLDRPSLFLPTLGLLV